MRFYWPIAKVDAEQRMVWGYASTEAIDDQGETVTRDALSAALGDYMRFANIREMHQPSAIGIAKEAAIDDKGLYLGAKIVDADAWHKVVEGVYKGFSIGGRVTGRDPDDRKTITSLALTEISVVDRPANPEAVFDCWKLSVGDGTAGGGADSPAAGREFATVGRPDKSGDDVGVDSDDPSDRGRGKTRRPARQGPDDLRPLAQLLLDLHWLRERIAGGATGDETDSPSRRRLHEMVDDLCDYVVAAIAQERAGRKGRGDDAASGDLAAMVVAGGLRKQRQPEHAPLTIGLAKLAEAIVPRLEALQQRIEDIACTPLPPQTAARGVAFAGVSKREDGGASAVASEDIVDALARMSDAERTLILIKAAHARPIAPFGAAGGPASR
jgi:hypothetical protein